MKEWTSTNPMTGETLWKGQDGEADPAVAAARAAAPGWAMRALAERIDFAHKFATNVKLHTEEFAAIIARETGKPLWEARAEVGTVISKVAISIQAQAERAGERRGDVAGIAQAVRHKPHGVLAVLGPYNFPAHLPNGHIVPALLAGNTIVFKPSELTPASGAFMVEMWRQAGLPDGVLNLVQGRAITGRALASHPGLDGLLFTGSSSTGLALHQAFATQPDRILAIETGGNNPLIAWDIPEADIGDAASLVVQSAFLSAGQRCTCARRLIIGPNGRSLIEAVDALAGRIIAGDPFDEPAPFMGPVIDERAAARVQDAWEALIELGGKIIRPLQRLRPGTPLLSPAIIDMTGIDAPDEEIFGPVLQVIRVPDFDAALAAANATRFGLSASLIGGDRALYDRFWAASRAGVVNWNRPTNGAASSAPFGGVGASGNHRPSAYYAADYCAWPVASLEADHIAGGTLTGLRD
jgi:succinylglutamic semialdehyde dehydrogenase